MIPKTFTNEELMPVFTPFGAIEELSILRGPEGQSKGSYITLQMIYFSWWLLYVYPIYLSIVMMCVCRSLC